MKSLRFALFFLFICVATFAQDLSLKDLTIDHKANKKKKKVQI